MLAGASNWNILLFWTTKYVIQPKICGQNIYVRIWVWGGLKPPAFFFVSSITVIQGLAAISQIQYPPHEKEEQQDPELWQWQTIFPPEQNKVDRAQRKCAHGPNHKWHHVWYRSCQLWEIAKLTDLQSDSTTIVLNNIEGFVNIK